MKRFLLTALLILAALPACGQIYTEGSSVLTFGGQPATLSVFTNGGVGFDFYIGPNGDDITGTGTIANPYSITWLCTLPNRTTSACGWTTYSGRRVGLLPGYYTQGKANGVVTTLASLATNTFGFGVGEVLYINGGTAGNPTVIGSASSSGLYLPRTATIDFSSGLGSQPQIPTNGIGQSEDGTGGLHMPPNFGNWTIEGLVLENFAQYGVIATYNGSSPIQNVTVQDCEIRFGAALSNNNPAAVEGNNANNLIIKNNLIHDNVNVSNFFTGSNTAGSISGTALTLTGSSGSYRGGIDPTPPVGAAIYLSNAPGTQPAAYVAQVNSATSYTLTAPLGTIASQPIYWGDNSAFAGFNYGFITFQSTNTQIINNSFYNVGIVATKDHTQSATVAYNYFEFGTFGTNGNMPNASPISGPSGVSNLITGAGMGQNWNHNIFVGVGQNGGGGKLIDFFGQDGTLNQGPVVFDHNTLYWPSTIGSNPNLLRVEQSTAGGQVGTIQYTNNLHWSDGFPIGTGFGWYVPVGGYTGITSDYNAYAAVTGQPGITFGTSFGVAQYTLPQWQTATGNDSHTITLGATPFSGTPTSLTPTTFAITGAPATASSTGGAIGALDGTGSVGTSLPAVPNITTASLPAATVGTAYSTTISVSGGSGSYKVELLSAPTINWQGWLTGGLTTYPFTLPGAVLGNGAIPSAPGSGWLTIRVTDLSTLQVGQKELLLTVNPA